MRLHSNYSCFFIQDMEESTGLPVSRKTTLPGHVLLSQNCNINTGAWAVPLTLTMRIAVNTRFLLNDYLEGYGNFLYETMIRITNAHPEHEFIFIFDRPFDPRFMFSPNIKTVVTGPPARHPLLWKLWYDIKIPAVLKKYKADVFVSCDGFCSLNTKVPQVLLVHDLSFLHYPDFIPNSHRLFFKHFVPKFLQKAEVLVTVSEFSRKDIEKHYPFTAGRLRVISNGAKSLFKPLAMQAREEIKKEISDGQEYFLYAGSIHPRKNLLNLLKAFSIFKKKQKSNWKLIIAGRLAWKYQSFVKGLASYKYRNDVHLTGYLPDEKMAQVMASAYALVYPSLWEGFGVPVLEAMRCEVPVITSISSAMEEVAGNAALYANPESFHDIAEKMLLVYKDEQLRADLIEKGKASVAKYSWENSSRELWELIQELGVPATGRA